MHYLDFLDVFSKHKADQLPPQRPYDCDIDLNPGSSILRVRVYPLSLPETKAMSEYVAENLQKGFIRNVFSLAKAGFSLWRRKMVLFVLVLVTGD